MRVCSKHRIIYTFVTKEFLINFIASFVFFFLIFFVNSILLLVERVALKNVALSDILYMVILSMPQFLIYTFPFSTLSASSMMLAQMGSSNEILALCSCGIKMRYVYYPVIVLSLIISLLNFYVSDFLMPYSNSKYNARLSELMVEMPTFELEKSSVSTVGNLILTNKDLSENEIYSLTLFNTDLGSENKTIVSQKGSINIINPDSFVYSLSLDDPQIMITDSSDSSFLVISDAKEAEIFLNFSDQLPSLTSTSPMNLTSKELLEQIENRNVIEEDMKNTFNESRKRSLYYISDSMKQGNFDFKDQVYSIENSSEPFDFYAQYYKAELTKKFALSLACFILTFISFPLAKTRMRYGRLTGFALSLLVAVLYWYLLFFVQLKIFEINITSYLLMMIPNIVIAFLALLLNILRRNRT